jgi:hypothetical protein
LAHEKEKLWAPKRIGKIIASRQYTIKNSRKAAFLLNIGCPVKDPTTKKGPWACPVQINGLKVKSFTFSFGEDSLQSLTLGLFQALRQLHSLSKEKGVEIEHFGPEFPLVFDWWDLAEAEKMMGKHYRKHFPAKNRTKRNRDS